MKRILFSLLIIFLLQACKKNDHGDNSVTRPNILLIIADDMGLDACPGYGFSSTQPQMPNLDKWITSGIKFNNFWTYPTCTPTRGSILTGKYGFRTGVQNVGDVLSISENSLHQELKNSGYATGQFGKWHLSNDATQPNAMGIDNFEGIIIGAVPSYTNWTLSSNGTSSTETTYTTTKLTDLAIDWIAKQDKPWFTWMAYNAPHTPFHLPPDLLHEQGSLPNDQASIDANPLPYYLASLEALDKEMGRLLNSLSAAERENTLIIFIGDNGSPGQVAQVYSNRRVKGSIYQGGVNCPLIVSGKGVNRFAASENALVSTVDLHSTILAAANLTSTKKIDSESFYGLLSDEKSVTKEINYTEIRKTNGTVDETVRDATHKYMLFGDGSESLYDLEQNPLENPNLLSANQAPLSTSDSLIWVKLKEKMIELKQ